MQPGNAIPPNYVISTLNAALQVVSNKLAVHGDDVMETGSFAYTGIAGCLVKAVTATGMEMSWGEVEEGIQLMIDYMSKYGFGGVSAAMRNKGPEIGILTVS